MTDAMHAGTAEGMLKFLGWAGAKGLMNKKTADAYKSASKKVLEIDEGWESMKISDLDPDVQLDRFTRLEGSRYTPQSLATYGKRLRTAVDLYQAYLADPTGFRVRPRRSRASARSGSKATSRTSAATFRASAANPTPRTPEPGEHPHERSGPPLITYPFPFRSGAMGYLQLPRELTRDDAQRLAAFVESLTLETSTTPPPAEDE